MGNTNNGNGLKGQGEKFVKGTTPTPPANLKSMRNTGKHEVGTAFLRNHKMETEKGNN